MTNDLQTYDLVVMGGGPAGITAATVASSFGKSVALVDNQEIGGAGINTGTVPSKTLREAALALSGLKSRNLYFPGTGGCIATQRDRFSLERKCA
jgi:NAD(P) transhydrogenase